MFYVYLIKSVSFPDQRYIGVTEDLRQRLKQHNAGESFHTSKYVPWELVNYFAFISKTSAIELREVFKNGFWSSVRKLSFLEMICDASGGKPH